MLVFCMSASQVVQPSDMCPHVPSLFLRLRYLDTAGHPHWQEPHSLCSMDSHKGVMSPAQEMPVSAPHSHTPCRVQAAI